MFRRGRPSSRQRPSPSSDIPVPPPRAIAAAAPALPSGMNTPFTPATADQYKLLDMVKTNSKLMWTSESEAHQFIRGLESILNISPVAHTHWPSLIFMMVPGDFELHRTWIINNILTPTLSWNAAKVAFINHFQHGDYLDGRRRLYSQCVQSNKETVQQYTERYETLATQLGLVDTDQLSIQHYVEGLHQGVQRKLTMYKTHMRTIGSGTIMPNPSWDFSSLANTIRLAITYDNEWVSMQQHTSLPLHLRHSPLANPEPSAGPGPTSRGTKRKPKENVTEPATETLDLTPKRVKSEEKKCTYHPASSSHTTEECRKKKGKEPTHPSPSTSQRTNPAPAPSPLNQQDISQIQCFKCNKMGHYANKCPTLTSAKESTKPKPQVTTLHSAIKHVLLPLRRNRGQHQLLPSRINDMGCETRLHFRIQLRCRVHGTNTIYTPSWFTTLSNC